MFRSGIEARKCDREMLEMCDSSGWSLCGEFAYAPLAEVQRTLAGSRRGASCREAEEVGQEEA